MLGHLPGEIPDWETVGEPRFDVFCLASQATRHPLLLKGWDKGQKCQVHSRWGLSCRKLGEWVLIHLAALASAWSNRSLAGPSQGSATRKIAMLVSPLGAGGPVG